MWTVLLISLMKCLCFSFQKCLKCNQNVEARALAIFAPKFGDSVLWHPDCFVCTECGNLLIDLTYCVHDDKLYCERHYAEQLKPRCAACDEVSIKIISFRSSKAMHDKKHGAGSLCKNNFR